MATKRGSDSCSDTLDRRPEARGFRIEQLLQDANLGRIRIPSFQRPLRWKSKQVIEFFDSIRRGFPVGELLVSRDIGDATQLRFGAVSITAPLQQNALWVIDGQQRVTALISSLLRKDKVPFGDYWAIWYDLEEESFVRLKSKVVPPKWIPLNVVNDSVALLKWIREWQYETERPDLIDRALDLGKAIREYEIPGYIVEGASEGLLRLIFTRVNSSGVSMRASEVFEARYGKEGNHPIRSAIARLADTGFGCLDEDLFLRCMRYACGLTKQKLIETPEALSSNLIDRTETAIRRSLRLLQLHAGIPTWKLLPYRLPLIVLCAFYDAFPNEDSRLDRLLAKWIWRGALTGDHDDVSDARVERLVKQIRSTSTPDIVFSEMLHKFDDQAGEMFENDPRKELRRTVNLRRASGKIFALALLAGLPCTPFSDEDYIDRVVGESEEDLDQSENQVDLPKESSLFLSLIDDGKTGADVVIKIADLARSDFTVQSDDSFLRSHFLSKAMIESLENEDLNLFRKLRIELLEDYFAKFVSDRFGDRTDVRPSIKAIVSQSHGNTSR